MSVRFTDEQQKLEESKKAITELLKEMLDDDDRFALIWFDDRAKVFQPMVEVGKRNLTELCQKIKEEIRPNDKSSPNSRVDYEGYDLAVQEFRKMCDKDEGAMEEAENRILIISALTLDEKTITKMETAATKDTRIHSSFI